MFGDQKRFQLECLKDIKVSAGWSLMMKIAPCRDVSEGEANVEVRVPECKSIAEM